MESMYTFSLIWTQNSLINKYVYLVRCSGDPGEGHPEGKLQPKEDEELHIAPAHQDPSVAACEVALHDKWLTDLHIDHAQHLLARYCSSLSGFQSTVLFESCLSVKVPTRKFIQILNVHSNHWLTVSNIDCAENSIKVFDSMANSHGLQNDDKFNCQVASLLDYSSGSIRVINVDVKQQEGYSDCGLFAIACATSLCFGMPPENQNYAQELMRSHLADCFRNGVMMPFPVVSTSFFNKSNLSSYIMEICVICRKPKSNDNPLIECMMCNQNFHFKCDNSIDTSIFICSKCKNFISNINFS